MHAGALGHKHNDSSELARHVGPNVEVDVRGDELLHAPVRLESGPGVKEEHLIPFRHGGGAHVTHVAPARTDSGPGGVVPEHLAGVGFLTSNEAEKAAREQKRFEHHGL